METIVRCNESDELVVILRRFLELYDEHRDAVQDAAERLKLAGAPTGRKRRSDGGAVALLSLLGGGLGLVVGGLSGGVWGLLGAVGATAYIRLSGHVNAVGATVGFMGGAFGGLLGGAFSGAVSCTIEVLAAVSGRPIHSATSRLLWSSVGLATGGAIGSVFGGSVGAAGGATGGALGALFARIVAIYISAGTASFSRRLKGSGERAETDKMIRRRLSGSLAALEAELQRLRREMKLADTLRDVTRQTARTRTAVSTLEETLSDCEEAAAGSLHSASCWEEGARRCRETLEELETLKKEVQEALASLETCDRK